MSNQNQAYPPPATSYPPEPQGGYMTAPPPAGYPTKDGQPEQAPAASADTKSRGDGFWKGCCAALCCCCVLDACF
ncbi:cysteine-rich and transmembrane domain-containing protein B-like [Salvia splendens]|uniref:cysteine-rich and transmembrane domain-containing protein B-like n=1 Tax=Salvia splendens TaxID=180675 RepID=UPI001C27361E|nr:cysteine-rich and transmembrane domain-containing protein B-like [Salvia splendens]